MCKYLGNGADRVPVVVTTCRPSSCGLELVGILDGRQVLGVDDKEGAAQRVGGIAVGHPSNRRSSGRRVACGVLNAARRAKVAPQGAMGNV